MGDRTITYPADARDIVIVIDVTIAVIKLRATEHDNG
jgi:hypothetical protein